MTSKRFQHHIVERKEKVARVSHRSGPQDEPEPEPKEVQGHKRPLISLLFRVFNPKKQA